MSDQRTMCRRRIGSSLWLLVTVFLASVSAADQPTAHRTNFECRWCDSEIQLDGLRNESAWAKADWIDDFYLPWASGSPSAQSATRAALLWDRENLYFYADLTDRDLFADITEHDAMTWLNDVFELFFRPSAEKTGYYEFQVNAAGTRLDMFLPSQDAGGYEKLARDGGFEFEASVKHRGTLNVRTDRDEGWSVEGRIPWTDLLRTGGRPNPNESWKFALCRYDYGKDMQSPELSTCAPLNRQDHANFHDLEGYATLRFMGPNSGSGHSPSSLEHYTPVSTSRVVGSPEPPNPYRAQRVFPKLSLSWPIFVAAEPGTDRLLMIDQESSYGKARLLRVDPQRGVLETLLELDGVAYSLAFHPDFAANGFVYVGWNGPLSDAKNRHSKVTRFTIDRQMPHRLDAKSEQLVIEWESDGHNGAAITFGKDGMLYITSGDGTSDSDTNVKGQGLDHLLAKVLRIDVDHPQAPRNYSVPADNPFVELPNARPETWAYGLRNPWRIATDPETGDIWVGNNGQDLWEQAYRLERGANYGWSVYEGSHWFYPGRQVGPTPHVKPTVEHPHSEFRSLTGGVVYHGDRYPDLQGAYIYGDYSTGKIWGVKVGNRGVIDWNKELADTTLQISAFAIDARGELLILDHRGDKQGGLYSLEPNDASGSTSSFPRTLSETGLFASVADHQVQAGLIPYSVNAPLWSDGALKERFIALPGEHPEIEVTASRGWNFPDQTVLVKSFALETRTGDPSSRRWVETRLLTKQQGEWVGYSYRWNDEQTDAELVGKEGAEQTFQIEGPEGKREQVWQYPSRTQCMVCHSRAANYVLGPTTAQLNRDHDYGGGRVENQLQVLERLGVLRVDWHTPAASRVRKTLEAKGLGEAEGNDEFNRRTNSGGQRKPVRSTLLAARPAQLERLVDPYDDTQTLDDRARSYLHANCAHCHVEAGGGNAQVDFEFSVARDKRNLIDVRPLHHTFGISDARLIAPGEPERSVLLHRLITRGSGQMPPLASSVVDEPAVAMLRRWIQEMK